MFSRYVTKGELTPEDFNLLFENLEKKYEDRRKTYVICEHDSWDKVAEKWEEFISTAGGISPAWEDLEKGVGGRAEKIAEAATDMSLSEYVGGLVKVNLNNMSFRAGFEEIRDNIGDYLPNVEVPTQEGLLQALAVADVKYDIDVMRTDMTSYFEALYKNTSDASVELLVDELADFNKTIEGSFPKLEMVMECAETMNNRQCPNKF